MDILSPALSLEDTYYTEGLLLGQKDGAKAGLVDGRRFGLEKGFDKFAAAGRLHGRSIVWNSRLPLTNFKDRSAEITVLSDVVHQATSIFLPQLFNPSKPPQTDDSLPEDLLPPTQLEKIPLPIFSDSASTSRLQKHIITLYALTELETLSSENNEDAVSDFDDRYRRALAKASIIGRMVGERVDGGMNSVGDVSGVRNGEKAGEGEPEMEDIAPKKEDRKRDGDRESRQHSKLEVEII